MESHTAKNGIPKFAMDDVEIVLDELCSGYDNATECRMRRELFDHYQSAFDDAVEDGLSEEDAHEKVLQDLGWETTLMVGKVCKGLNNSQQTMIHKLIFSKDKHPLKTLGLLVACLSFMSIVAFVPFDRVDWRSSLIPCFVLVIMLYDLLRLLYRRKHVVKKQPVNMDDIKKLLLKPVYLMGIYYGVGFVLLLIFSLFFPEVIPGSLFVIALALSASIMLVEIGPVYAFIRRWKKLYPDSRIF